MSQEHRRRFPRDDLDCVAVEKPGRGVRRSSHHALGGDAGREGACRRMVHPRRRRRLVGRGEISLSPFLDPEWMLEQQQRNERHLAHLREAGEGSTGISSAVNSALKETTARPGSNHSRQAISRGGGPPGAGEDTDYASTLSAPQNMARSHYGAVIHDSCNLVLEEWVAQGSGCSDSHGNEDADADKSSNDGGRGRGDSEGRKTPTARVDDAAQPLSTVSIQVNTKGKSSRSNACLKGKAVEES